MSKSSQRVAVLLIVSYGFAFAFDYKSHVLSDNAFYFVRSLLSVIICYAGFGFIDVKKGIKGNWRLILICALSLIDAAFLFTFLTSYFFVGLYSPTLYLYWDADLSWRIIYKAIEWLLISELVINGIIYLYRYIHDNHSNLRQFIIQYYKKAHRL